MTVLTAVEEHQQDIAGEGMGSHRVMVTRGVLRSDVTTIIISYVPGD